MLQNVPAFCTGSWPWRRRLRSRRIPSEALVRKFVLKYPNDPSFGQLKDALAAQDWETAFRASHTLKGVAQNLGMEHLCIRYPRPCARLCAAPSP